MRRPLVVPAALLAVLLSALTGLTAPSWAATPARPSPTTISGWASAPASVVAGTPYVARVRVSGGRRDVRLQRLSGGAWRTLVRVPSTSTGRATLTWTAPATAGPVALRVHVARTSTRAAAASSARRVLVVPVTPAPDPLPDPDPVPEPEPTPDPQPDPQPDPDPLGPVLAEVLTLVNQARAAGRTCGDRSYPAVPALTAEPRLTRAAGRYASLMATDDFFSHTGPDGSSPGDRIEAEGYRWRAWGENIAAGQRNAASVVAGWLASAGHCANIMSASFTEIGLGQASDTTSRYGTYWVQDFGRPQ